MTYDLKELSRLHSNALTSNDFYDQWHIMVWANFPAILRDLKRLAAQDLAIASIPPQWKQIIKDRTAVCLAAAAEIEKG